MSKVPMPGSGPTPTPKPTGGPTPKPASSAPKSGGTAKPAAGSAPKTPQEGSSPQFSKPAAKQGAPVGKPDAPKPPKSNNATPPKPSKDATPEAPKGASGQKPAADTRPSRQAGAGDQSGPPKSSKDLLKDQRNASSASPGASTSSEPKQSKAGQAADSAKKKAGDTAGKGLDAAVGSGATDDLKNMVAKEDKHGDKVSMEERGISAAKNAGRAANVYFAGNNKAINTAIDKTGNALSAVSRKKKRTKRELKEAVTGKSMMDAATGSDSKKNQPKRGAGLGAAAQTPPPGQSQGGKGKDGKSKGSGTGEASGTSVAKKAAIGVGGFLLVIVLLVVAMLGGGLDISGDATQPNEESDESVQGYIPGETEDGEGGWYEVAKEAVKYQKNKPAPHEIPWTMIMGLAAEQTDMGRYSPYDAIDRDPDRETDAITSGNGGGSSGTHTGNVNIQNTGDMDRSNPAWRQQVAMEAFVSAGFTPEQSAGIVGNMITESGVEPAKAEIGKPFPSDWGWGLVQWTFSRNTTIVNKVKSELGDKFYTDDASTLNDDEWIDLMEFQVSFVIEELDTTHAHVGGPLRAATTVEEASNLFLEKYEIPADIPGNRPVRAAQSKEVLRIYNEGGVDAISGGDVSVNTTREEAEWLTFNTQDTVRLEPVSTSTCVVPNPEPPIGGGEDEGVGPFLLTEQSAADARDAGYDPNSPCVARWIADELSRSSTDTYGSDDFQYHKKAPWPFGDAGSAGGSGNTGGGGSIGSGDGPGSIQHPIEGSPTPSSGFGPRPNPTGAGYGQHKGVDWAVPGGTPIGSVADGTVSHSNPNSDGSGWGNYVIVDHEEDGKAFQSLYAHMEAPSPLSVGDNVKTGDVVGNVGTTGDSTGNHLHLEIIVGGERIDPEPLISGDSNISAGLDLVVESGNVSNSEEEEEAAESEDEEDLSEEEEQKKDFEDNVAFWEEVVRKTDIFADRNASGATCELQGGDGDGSANSVTQQIIYSFHCEFAKLDKSETVEQAAYEPPAEGLTEDEIKDYEAEPVFKIIEDRYDAEQKIIQEALLVSYVASEWNVEACNPDEERAGLFQLTAAEMREGGFSDTDRCDPAKNAAAAAKLFADGERDDVDRRRDNDGDFQPALGGWDNVSIALGEEDREDFVQLGTSAVGVPIADKCFESMGSWVDRVVEVALDKRDDEDTATFIDFAGLDDLSPEEIRAKAREGSAISADSSGGGILGFGGHRSPHLVNACAGGSERDYAESLGEVAASKLQSEEDEDAKRALNGYIKWTEFQRNTEGGTPVVGSSSLVPRLSVYSYSYPEVPVTQDVISQMILDEVGGREGYVPLHQRAVEYAIFFGGISEPFDTATKIYGSLEDAVGSGRSGGRVSGGGQTEVDASGCPVEPGPIAGAMTGGSEAIGINELCKRSVEQARDAAAATALKWGFQQVGVQMYSQPQRMDPLYSDCSSFISRAYQEAAGVHLYPEGGNAWVTGTFISEEGAPSVPQSELVPGDWFEPSSGHIVFIISDGFIMHASQPGDPIKIGTFYTGDYNKGGTIDPSAYPEIAPTADVGGSSGSDDEEEDEKEEEDDE